MEYSAENHFLNMVQVLARCWCYNTLGFTPRRFGVQVPAVICAITRVRVQESLQLGADLQTGKNGIKPTLCETQHHTTPL
jgi:hypothetical protein